MTCFQIIFWGSFFAIVYSYVIYPWLLHFIVALRGKKKFKSFSEESEFPKISILMAAYNEDLIIEKKIETVFSTQYPLDKIEMLVGSDCSTDRTNEIVERLSRENERIHFFPYTERQGKINIINQLVDEAQGEILIITDANVLFQEQTLPNLIRFFADEKIGLVDTQMKNYGWSSNGISFQEKSYISREVYVKQLESLGLGTMIGPFGGCYAVRKTLFVPVPKTYLVDDFFVCMNVLKQGFYAVNDIDSLVFEDVSNDLGIEFKRKIRIGTGNFQNLCHFRSLFWPPFSPVAFAFFSHKVLRWFGPFFIIFMLISNAFLLEYSALYKVLFLAQITVTILPLIDLFFKKIGAHIVLLRFTTHFYGMNLSLLIGFFKSIKGVKNNVWKPTKRLQK